jgi:hypothetical protein
MTDDLDRNRNDDDIRDVDPEEITGSADDEDFEDADEDESDEEEYDEELGQ